MRVRIGVRREVHSGEDLESIPFVAGRRTLYSTMWEGWSRTICERLVGAPLEEKLLAALLRSSSSSSDCERL